MNTRRVYSAKVDRTSGIICDQSIALNGHYIAKDYPQHLRRIRFKDPETQQTLVFLTNNTSLPPLTIAALYKKPLAGGIVFQMDQAAPAHQEVSGQQRERSHCSDFNRTPLGIT